MKKGSVTLRGMVERVYCSKPNFCAGVLAVDDGDTVRFRGKFAVAEGECVTLTGYWVEDPKFGRQLVAQSVAYDLPESSDGLSQYLAKNPAFTGIGDATAQKIVRFAGSADQLEKLLTGDLAVLRTATRIPLSTLETLRDVWKANATGNRIRTYLAAFGLSHGQMEKLITQFGEGIVGILKTDPYQLIQLVDSYGFKRVDEIAQKFGVPKNHPGRIEAGILHIIREEMNSGHTWTGGIELLELVNTLLVLDGLDSRQIIQDRAQRLITDGKIAVDGRALSTPEICTAETLIRDCFRDFAWTPKHVCSADCHASGLQGAQLKAFETALTYPISVISGGAGTGKTYTVARLTAAFQSAGMNVALCAPTGKAAKRIEELLHQYGVDAPALTIHRLLQYNGHEFKRPSLSEPYEVLCDIHPAYQVVLIDEVSMTDVPLMAAVLQRIDFTKTRLVLVGDHNQLPPVGPGNVLRDILKHKLVPTVILDKVHRQAGTLKTNSNLILNGMVAPSASAENGWLVLGGCKEPVQIQTQLRDLFRDEAFSRIGFEPLRDVQVITPTHKGPLGTREVNKMLQYLFHGEVKGKFTVGDKVIQTSNDYDMDVMNGTIGYVAESTDTGFMIYFDGAGMRPVENERLYNIQLAYCMTAHKGQGSEFPCVIVLCHKSHFFADRNWLYTAVTRASKTCILLGDRWGLKNAASKNRTILRRTLLSKWAGESAQLDKSIVEVST